MFLGQNTVIPRDAWASAARFAYYGRLVEGAHAYVAVEGHARCLTDQWHELYDLGARIGEHADALAHLIGSPHQRARLVVLALDYARERAQADRLHVRGNARAAVAHYRAAGDIADLIWDLVGPVVQF